MHPFPYFFLLFACRIREKALPLHSHLKQGVIAQLVEQRTENPCVPGSIPGDTTMHESVRQQVWRFFRTYSPGRLCPHH